MDIKTVITYKVDGIEFGDLSHVKAHIENELGTIIDSGLRLPPKQALIMLNILIHNRTRLINLLSTNYECEGQNWQDENVSIFKL